MDLGAYAKIEDLEAIAEANGNKVPRLRGYRLMKEESPVDINSICDEEFKANICMRLCTNKWNSDDWYTFNDWTDYLKNYYTVRTNGGGRKIRWNRIHGRKRKILKTCIHNKIQKVKKQYAVWNKYVGRDDVLYIHARIGGGNWSYYHAEVDSQPWFLEKVDDAFDSTYCDIYARI